MEKLDQKYNKCHNKTDIYSLDQIKIALDDFLVECLSSVGFKENNFYVDFVNTIGLISTFIGLLVSLLSCFFTWQTIKFHVTYCVAIYFITNILFFPCAFFYGGKIRFDGLDFLTSISITDDNTPVYVVMGYKKNKVVPLKYSKSVYELFYDDGKMDHNLLIEDFKRLFKENDIVLK